MTWTLGIDCSSVEMGLGLWAADGGATAALSRYTANSHAEHIAASVRFLLSDHGVAPESISRIGVAVGPGSFTGLRIAIAFVKGFAFGRNDIRVLPVSSLANAAMAWPARTGRVVVAFDARGGEVFWARFEYAGNRLRRLTEDRKESAAVVFATLEPEETVLTDSVGYVRSSVFAPLAGRAQTHALEQAHCLRGLACARTAAAEPENSLWWRTATEVVPVYLRATYAQKESGPGGRRT